MNRKHEANRRLWNGQAAIWENEAIEKVGGTDATKILIQLLQVMLFN